MAHSSPHFKRRAFFAASYVYRSLKFGAWKLAILDSVAQHILAVGVVGLAGFILLRRVDWDQVGWGAKGKRLQDAGKAVSGIAADAISPPVG